MVGRLLEANEKWLQRHSAIGAITLVALFSVLAPVQANALADQAPVLPGPPTPDELLLNYALVSKKLADEQFLKQRPDCELPSADRSTDQNHKQDNLEDRYRQVLKYLKNSDVVWSESRKPIRSLLIKDIEYRLLLVKRCLPFWGGIRSRTPGIPSVHLATMAELVGELEELVNETNLLIERKEDLALDAFKSQAAARGFQTDIARGRINERRADTLRVFAEERRRELLLEVKELNAQRMRFAMQQEKLDARFNYLSNSIQHLIADGIGQSLGLPPNLGEVVTRAVNGKDLEKALLNVGAGMLGELDLEHLEKFSDVLVQYSDEIEQFQQTYDDVQKIASTVQESSEIVRSAGHALANGQLEKFVRSGLEVFNVNAKYLPEEYKGNVDKWKDHWKAVVEQTKPVQALLSIGREIGITNENISNIEDIRKVVDRKVRQVIADSQSLTKVLPTELERIVRSLPDYDLNIPAEKLVKLRDKFGNFTDIDLLYRSVFKAAVSVNWDSQSRNEIIALFVRTQPNHFLTKIREQTNGQQRMLKLHAAVGVNTQSELIEWLSTNSIGNMSGILLSRTDQGEKPDLIQMRVNVGTPSDSIVLKVDLNELFDAKKFDVSRLRSRELANLLMPVLKDLCKKHESIAEQIVSNLPYEDLMGIITSLAKFGALTQDTLWTKLNNAVPDSAKTQTVEYLAATLAGQSFIKARKVRTAEPSGSVQQFPATEGDKTTRGNAIAETALRYAMDAVFPGAGIAFQITTKVLGGLSEMNHLAKEIENYQRQIRETYRKQIHLMDMARESQLNIRLQELESQLAQLVQDGATSQLASYQQALVSSREAKQYVLRSIQIRKALIFYLLERLREEFDQLDRTLGLWIGEAGRPYGTIAELITSDPQFIRLAVDSDIHLYDWLDRDAEQSRADFQTSLAHWRQLYRLSRDICAIYGCLPGNARLGQVAQTQRVALSRLVTPAAWKRFREWQASEGVDGSLQLSFFIDRHWSEINPRHENVRVIDIRIGIQHMGITRPTSQVTIIHPGISFILSDGNPGTEVLVPMAASGFDSPEPFKLEALADRWNVTRPSRRPLEGYGLFSNWRIEIAPTAETLLADEIFVRIAYQFNDAQVSRREKDYLVKVMLQDTTDSGMFTTTMWLDNRDFTAFSTKTNLLRRLLDLFKDKNLGSENLNLPSIQSDFPTSRNATNWLRAGTVEIGKTSGAK